jgi:2-keto-4-pentenoate hydratase/2-oxohepta-3-ene-1,7-dioic acid hydratase in catechol pathway
MRLVTYLHDGAEKLGAWVDGDANIVDLAEVGQRESGDRDPRLASMQALIEGGDVALELARRLTASPQGAIVATRDVQLLAPLPRPVQFRDCLAFPAHLAGCNMLLIEMAAAAAPDPAAAREAAIAAGKADVPETYFKAPFYYNCNSMTVVGPDAEIAWPGFSSFIDYELELAIVIGKGGSQIEPSSAHEHIFGYTIFNDWSARDEQIVAMDAGAFGGPFPSKDFANSIGPCIVTADEIADAYDLEMEAYVNGQLVGSGNSSGMHYRWGDLLAYLTRGHALHPGEVIGSGTVGTGCSLENRHLVKHGDVIELKVPQIGTLRNRVSAPHLDGKLPDTVVHALGAAIQQARARQTP